MNSRGELKHVLKDYKINWQVWTNSPACFLDPMELRLIDESLSDKSSKECAKCLGVSEMDFTKNLIMLVHKLKLKVLLYEKWNEDFFTESYFENEEEEILNTNYNFLPISRELKQWLFYTHQPTLQKLIENYSELDLIVLYEFPEHLIFELKTFIGYTESFCFGSKKIPTKKQNIIKVRKPYQLEAFKSCMN